MHAFFFNNGREFCFHSFSVWKLVKPQHCKQYAHDIYKLSEGFYARLHVQRKQE